MKAMSDQLVIGGVALASRLFLGSGKYSSNALIPAIVEASGAQVITVAVRRVDPEAGRENILCHIPKSCVLMPNTSGARNAREAVRIARLARAGGCGDWIKIEVISDNRYLLPDNQETIEATRILAGEGFTVLPYMSPDLMAAKRLAEEGNAYLAGKQQDGDAYLEQKQQEGDAYFAQKQEEGDGYLAQKTQDADTYFSDKHTEADNYEAEVQKRAFDYDSKTRTAADDYAQQVRDNLETQTKVIEGNIKGLKQFETEYRARLTDFLGQLVNQVSDTNNYDQDPQDNND